MQKEEEAIREQLSISVKTKVATKLEVIEGCDDLAKEIEMELIRDLEGLVQQRLTFFRDTLEDKVEDYDFEEVYKKQDYYWSGEPFEEDYPY